MELGLIVAKSKNNVIGLDNQLPWHLPEDLKHFKNTTLGCPIIMGRNTWVSLGRPLPGRRNIVISRTPNFQAEGAEVFKSLDEAINACQDVERAFIIGGAQIYALAIDRVDTMVITEVDTVIEGDAYFPEITPMWQETDRESHHNGSLGYAFVTYRRK